MYRKKFNLFFYFFMYTLFKFRYTFFFFKKLFNRDVIFLKSKKKNLFFKKKFENKILVSKRLNIVSKKKKFKFFKKTSKRDTGNFFFKKFFFKTLLKNRRMLVLFFNRNKRTRQKKITKLIFKNTKNIFFNNQTCEYSLLNILVRSHFFLFVRDALFAIKNNFVFLNGCVVTKNDLLLTTNDCVQLSISKSFLIFLKICKRFLKKKISMFRYSSWKFFKNKFLKKKKKLKSKKRKNPKHIEMLFLFKLNTPKLLEIDFLTLSILILYKDKYSLNSYFLYKSFSFKLFNLYNFKKIN